MENNNNLIIGIVIAVAVFLLLGMFGFGGMMGGYGMMVIGAMVLVECGFLDSYS